MKNTKLIETLTQLLKSLSSETATEDKMDLILSKIDILQSDKETDDEHLLINEVCKLTRKSRVTIYNWRKDGKLCPIGKSGKNHLYLKSDVIKFIHNNGA
jgi:predicted DNA-binding transcriptional regulator AlpA